MILPSISQQQQWLRVSPLSGNNTGLKRKRRLGITSQTKGYRPPLKTPQLGAPLVDYDEDDEDTSPTAQSSAPQISGSNSVQPSDNKPSSSPSLRSASPSPSTPTTSSSSIITLTSSGPPPKRTSKEDEEDNILESLVRNTRARSQSPSPSLGPMRPSEKRRRTNDDDDDDELLMRLSKPSKKPDLGYQKDSSPSIGARAKNGDDPLAKKIKVKFNSGSLPATSSAPQPTTTTTPTTTGSSTPSDLGKKEGIS